MVMLILLFMLILLTNGVASGPDGADTMLLHLLADKLGFKLNIKVVTSFEAGYDMVCMPLNILLCYSLSKFETIF